LNNVGDLDFKEIIEALNLMRNNLSPICLIEEQVQYVVMVQLLRHFVWWKLILLIGLLWNYGREAFQFL
jgi:hypothetical protein